MAVNPWIFLSTSLFLSAWWLNFHIPPRNPPLVNYDQQIFFDHSSSFGPLLLPNMSYITLPYLAPSSKEEVIMMIKAVAGANKGEGPKRRIRVLGAGHSWSTVAKSDDLLLSLCNYKGLVSVDSKLRQATFRGGTILREVNAILHKHGLAMSQLGSISDQTVAGSIATGTHGSGIKFGNLATLVVRIELITGRGDVLILSSSDNNTDLFRAAQVSVGLLGVISEVTFQCEPSFNLEETRSFLPLETCLGKMKQLVSSAQHVKMWVEVFSQKCVLYQCNRTKDESRDNPSPLIHNLKSIAFEAFINVLSLMPSQIPAVMNLLFKYGDLFPPYSRVDTSYKVFNIPYYFPNHNEAELVVDITNCASAIKELKHFVEKEKIPLNYVTEIRFVEGDSIPLSPNYERDSCHLTLCITRPSDADRLRYFRGMFKHLTEKGLEPRIHWGKYFDLGGSDVTNLYPEVNKFLNIRDKLDPDQIFVNSLLSGTLGIV